MSEPKQFVRSTELMTRGTAVKWDDLECWRKQIRSELSDDLKRMSPDLQADSENILAGCMAGWQRCIATLKMQGLLVVKY